MGRRFNTTTPTDFAEMENWLSSGDCHDVKS